MPASPPRATYRVQLTKDFIFNDAAKLVPYLKSLGISHLYASPFLTARPGSTHGYDIVDHNRLSPELGGEEGFARLSEALAKDDIGLILDFVPNHMGVGLKDNAWWLDVLEWGPKSPHAASFDIEWEALPNWRHPAVLLPILGKPYGEALESGEIELKYDVDTGTFAAWYFEHKLPINPQRYGEIIRQAVTAAGANDDPAGHELIALAHRYRDPRSPSYGEAEGLKHALSAIPGAADVITRGLVAYSGKVETGRILLHRLLERQHFRVAYWRVAFSSINYRRFFDVNDLAGLRVEHAETFRAVHTLVARLLAENKLHGIRLDHIDGLRDPAQYARRLRQLVRKATSNPIHVTIEKILGEGEALPEFSGVGGTTGYEWLNLISHVLVDGKGLQSLDQTWREVSGITTPFPEIVDRAKQRVVETLLASEFAVLIRLLARIAAGHYSTRDYTAERLAAALRLYVLEFPVYRTYITAAGASERDRKLIDDTITRARARWEGPDPEIFDFLKSAVSLELSSDSHYSAPRVRNFALKLQQFTGPLMAKSLEDTAFYRFHRLLALNEVGGEPDAPPLSTDAFHRKLAARVREMPLGLTATATHDTKRGEDARTRILALSEMADEWRGLVAQCRSLNAVHVSTIDSALAPSPAHEYMLYQTLIGVWPHGGADADLVERVQGYVVKAMREGKQQTSWTNPNEGYENAVKDFVAAILDTGRSAEFLRSFGEFAARTALIGALNGLSQLTLKAMMPGIPDFYQGTEFWDLSLVDPDNRRPVDYAARSSALSRLMSHPGAAETGDWQALASAWPSGEIKLALTRRLLAVRTKYADVLSTGTHIPVEVSGPKRDHVVAFARKKGRQEIIVAVGRHFASLTGNGQHWPVGTFTGELIPPSKGEFEDVLGAAMGIKTARPDVATLFSVLPLAVLRRN